MGTLVEGVHHIAVLTTDMERCIRFYQKAFDATVKHDERNHAGHPGARMVMLSIGERSALHVFEVPGNTPARLHIPMFGRGRIDPCGLNASSRETFEHLRVRLRHLGTSDGTMTDCGTTLRVCFRDPDGLEAEVLWNQDPVALVAGSTKA